MVDSPGLENRYSSKQRTIEGSNPSLSFYSVNRFVAFLFFIGFARIKGNGSAIPLSRARKKNRLEDRNELKRKEKGIQDLIHRTY